MNRLEDIYHEMSEREYQNRSVQYPNLIRSAPRDSNHNQLYFDTAARVAAVYNVSPDKLIGTHTRKQPLAEARQLVMYILREHDLTYQEIGCIMDRDHSTVMYVIREIQGRIESGQMRCSKQLLQQLINQQ